MQTAETFWKTRELINKHSTKHAQEFSQASPGFA